MKRVKNALATITIMFAMLGILGMLDYAITDPLMFFSLAALLLVRGIEYKKAGNKKGFFLMVAAVVLCCGVTIYTAFIR